MSAATVKHALTPERAAQQGRTRHPGRYRRRVENDDYAAFTRRVLAAHGRRIAHGDIEGLATLAALADDIDHALHEAITGLRGHGYSWADIAHQLGITRQAAHQRWAGGAS